MARVYTIPSWKCFGCEKVCFYQRDFTKRMFQGEYYKRGYQEGTKSHHSPIKYLTLPFSDLPQHVQRQALGNVRALAELQR